MRRTSKVLTILVIVLLIGTAAIYQSTITGQQTDNQSISSKAVTYLINSYNYTMHLFPETSANTVFYITSDNLLAYYAIKDHNSTIADDLRVSLMGYTSVYNLPVGTDNLPISFKHEAIIGQALNGSIHDAIPHQLLVPNATGYTIYSERADATTVAATSYADILAIQGLSYCELNQSANAQTCYNQMMTYWDGHGFADDAYTNPNSSSYHICATYKLGLALLLSNKLDINNATLDEQMLNTIKTCQLDNGGVRTDYTFNGSITPSGSVNTETTAIIAIATSTLSQTSNGGPTPPTYAQGQTPECSTQSPITGSIPTPDPKTLESASVPTPRTIGDVAPLGLTLFFSVISGIAILIVIVSLLTYRSKRKNCITAQ